ncbi:MAG: hypothetical protein ABIP51_01530 [Bacteroidia bacterium]
MTNIPDIHEKIKADFGAQAEEAFELIKAAIVGNGHLNDARIIRCIIFLADKKIEQLRSTIRKATIDPRDIMLWAEYIQSGPGDQTKRVRDFNKTFDQSENDVRE